MKEEDSSTERSVVLEKELNTPESTVLKAMFHRAGQYQNKAAPSKHEQAIRSDRGAGLCPLTIVVFSKQFEFTARR
jgi:hypothetical protein